jgi:hypothetical protein
MTDRQGEDNERSALDTMASPDSAELDKLVSMYPPSTQALISAARAALLTAFPKSTESVDSKARLIGYSYGPGYKSTVATLILSRTRLKIGVPYGAQLPDPEGLLAGQGKVHRHIPISTAAELESVALTTLLHIAFSALEARAMR